MNTQSRVYIAFYQHCLYFSAKNFLFTDDAFSRSKKFRMMVESDGQYASFDSFLFETMHVDASPFEDRGIHWYALLHCTGQPCTCLLRFVNVESTLFSLARYVGHVRGKIFWYGIFHMKKRSISNTSTTMFFHKNNEVACTVC